MLNDEVNRERSLACHALKGFELGFLKCLGLTVGVVLRVSRNVLEVEFEAARSCVVVHRSRRNCFLTRSSWSSRRNQHPAERNQDSMEVTASRAWAEGRENASTA